MKLNLSGKHFFSSNNNANEDRKNIEENKYSSTNENNWDNNINSNNLYKYQKNTQNLKKMNSNKIKTVMIELLKTI